MCESQSLLTGNRQLWSKFNTLPEHYQQWVFRDWKHGWRGCFQYCFSASIHLIYVLSVPVGVELTLLCKTTPCPWPSQDVHLASSHDHPYMLLCLQPNLLSASRNFIARLDVLDVTGDLLDRGEPVTLFLFSDSLEVSHPLPMEEQNNRYSSLWGNKFARNLTIPDPVPQIMVTHIHRD